jgi:hypothetical protein
MNNAKRRYKRKVRQKTITFYIHEAELYEYTKSLNFQAFVKSLIREKMLKDQMEERGSYGNED